MRWSWKIGKLAGIDVYVHATFLILILWVALVHWTEGHSLAAVAEGIGFILDWLRSEQVGLCFANLVDFDQLYGHRNDTAGFYAALRELDRALPSMLDALREDDLLFITADH